MSEKPLKVVCYERVSTKEQNPDHQRVALTAWVKEHSHTELARYVDKASGRIYDERPGFAEMMTAIRSGGLEPDAIICTRITRLGREAIETIAILHELRLLGIGYVGVEDDSELWPDTPSTKKLMMVVQAGFAGYEYDSRKEQCDAGIRIKKERWEEGKQRPGERYFGRPKIVLSDDDMKLLTMLLRYGASLRNIAQHLSPDRQTLRRIILEEQGKLREAGVDLTKYLQDHEIIE